MHYARLTRRLTAAALVATLAAGAGASVAVADSDKEKGASRAAEVSRDRAQKALEAARKALRKPNRTPAIVEARGAVAAVDAAAGTFDVTVTEANQSSLRGTRTTVRLGSPSYVALDGRTATLADVHVGDKAKVTGLFDATPRLVAYVAAFTRPALPPPAPARLQGPIVSVDPAAGSFVATIGGQPLTMFLGNPSLVTVNGQPATIADLRPADKVDATVLPDATARPIAYVVKASRPIPPASGSRIQGVVTAVTPATGSLTIGVGGQRLPVVVTVANPAIVNLNKVAATLADAHLGDRAEVTAIPGAGGVPVAYLVVLSRPASP